jgi:hypothetical protein
MVVRIKTIYLDMDGVLTDFDKKWFELYSEHPRRSKNRNNWKNFILNEGFKTLPTFPDWDKLIASVVNTGANIEILTSSGGEEFHSIVADQKKFWLKSHNIDFPVNVVPGRRFKKDFANPSTLLIDDTQDVVMAFHDAGGYAIQHTSFELTLPMLNSFFCDERIV